MVFHIQNRNAAITKISWEFYRKSSGLKHRSPYQLIKPGRVLLLLSFSGSSSVTHRNLTTLTFQGCCGGWAHTGLWLPWKYLTVLQYYNIIIEMFMVWEIILVWTQERIKLPIQRVKNSLRFLPQNAQGEQ